MQVRQDRPRPEKHAWHREKVELAFYMRKISQGEETRRDLLQGRRGSRVFSTEA